MADNSPSYAGENREIAHLDTGDDRSGISAVEKAPVREIDTAAAKFAPIPSTVRNICSEILARAQLGEPLSGHDREALGRRDKHETQR
jgi:hypothetical protein